MPLRFAFILNKTIYEREGEWEGRERERGENSSYQRSKLHAVYVLFPFLFTAEPEKIKQMLGLDDVNLEELSKLSN